MAGVTADEEEEVDDDAEEEEDEEEEEDATGVRLPAELDPESVRDRRREDAEEVFDDAPPLVDVTADETASDGCCGVAAVRKETPCLPPVEGCI